MEEQMQKQLKMDAVFPMEFIYDRISVDAQVQREVQHAPGKYRKQKAIRTILKVCSGKFSAGSMTAILGPSGSGKTTLLNLLSGRLLSKNLEVRGKLVINGEQVSSIGQYKSLIGYVMQEDLLMPTFTPYQTFKFVADLRLPDKTQEEKEELVQNLIDVLGLRKCSNTYVGNNLIRGISGGQRKRTSIGTQLLINPSLIFLDQPTTGLDSTTALHVIRFLNKLSSKGRTVITTIHQPSSEIFREIDRILLMLDGNIVYHGSAQASLKYFRQLGMGVPVHSNPMDHYMKIMNKEGIQLRYIEQGRQYSQKQVQDQFNVRVISLVSKYKQTQFKPEVDCKQQLKDTKKLASWPVQLSTLLKRNFLNIFRNPLALKAQFFQILFYAIINIIIYERQSDDFPSYIQNTAGLLNFTALNIVFVSVFSTLNIFSTQRPIFIRQRLANTYQASSYFTSRIISYLPLDILFPFILLVIFYFAVNLDNDADSLFMSAAALWLGAFMSSAYGFLISALISDPQVAMALVPVIVIPFLLLGGFYAPLNQVHDFFRWIEYLSMFRYTYQALIYAQFSDDANGLTVTFRDGSQFTYEGNILTDEDSFFYIQEPYWLILMLMGIIGLVLRILAFLALYLLSNPKQLNLQPPAEDARYGADQRPLKIQLKTNEKQDRQDKNMNQNQNGSTQSLKKSSQLYKRGSLM